MKHGLSGHLVHNFTYHPENLATEALDYILKHSIVAKNALIEIFRSTGAMLPADLNFFTQVADHDNAIPDLVGLSKENEQVVICESKFWAGLTDNQPVTYLKRLPKLLIFVSPEKRIPTLWAELLTRCNHAGMTPQETEQPSGKMRVAKLPEHQILAATSWRSVLESLHQALLTHGELDTASDVRQLQGLCNRMDTDAFLPIRSKELAPAIAIRNLQFNEVVDSITDELVHRGMASIAGFRSTAFFEGYGRYMRVGEFGWLLQINSRYWSTLRETPLWLSVKHVPEKGNWTYSSEAAERLSPLHHENPPQLIRESDNLLIPLTMKFGVEKTQVIDSLLVQLDKVFDLLKRPLSDRIVAGQ